MTENATTENLLLGGRIRLIQPDRGYRVAIDPIFLAASVTAQANEYILDAGCGVGAAALCLTARLQNCAVAGVERDPQAASLANRNVALNDMQGRIVIAQASFQDYAKANNGAFDQAISNPPFYPRGAHTQSPVTAKAAAHGEGDADLDAWVTAASVALKPGGKLTLIHRADRLGDILAAFTGRFGAAVIFPLWPRDGVEAKRILVSAIKGRKTAPRLLAGLVLHGQDGKFTPQAEAVLRDAQHLDFGDACG